MDSGSLAPSPECHATAMPRFEDLPYRPCAGTVRDQPRGPACSSAGALDGPEHIDATHVWQMPQGGIDEGEEPYPAALRELYEETNIKSVEKLGEIKDWLTYDIPREIVGQGLEAANIAARSRSGTRCASPARTARSTSSTRPAATSRSSSNGAGSRWRTFPTWWCRSSARPTSGW